MLVRLDHIARFIVNANHGIMWTADNLSKAGWSWGCVSAVDFNGRSFYTQSVFENNAKSDDHFLIVLFRLPL